jgi:hypothetical protein
VYAGARRSSNLLGWGGRVRRVGCRARRRSACARQGQLMAPFAEMVRARRVRGQSRRGLPASVRVCEGVSAVCPVCRAVSPFLRRGGGGWRADGGPSLFAEKHVRTGTKRINTMGVQASFTLSHLPGDVYPFLFV